MTRLIDADALLEDITQEKLKELFSYDSSTGLFFRIKAKGSQKAGSKAGAPTSDGYLHIAINYKKYKAHRLAWLYTYGSFPKESIDHINGNKMDNRICNLREASKIENARNEKLRKNNTSGYKGVCFDKKTNKWRSQGRINRKIYFLGFFNTAEDASTAYVEFAKINHGEFYNEKR